MSNKTSSPPLEKTPGYGLHLIKSKTSTEWYFVGTVPSQLAYENIDGSPISASLAKDIASFGFFLFKSKVCPKTYPCKESAIEAAHSLGFAINFIQS